MLLIGHLRNIVNTLWLLAGTALMLTVLGFFLFERYVLNPISLMAHALRDEAQRAKESTDRIAYLEGQLRTARRTAIRVINASQTSLATVKQVRSDLAVENPPQDVLDPLVHSLEQVVSTVQDLKGLARESKVRPPPQAPSR